jgi:hypothetical protein
MRREEDPMYQFTSALDLSDNESQFSDENSISSCLYDDEGDDNELGTNILVEYNMLKKTISSSFICCKYCNASINLIRTTIGMASKLVLQCSSCGDNTMIEPTKLFPVLIMPMTMRLYMLTMTTTTLTVHQTT